ncbi:ferrous iron transport protein B [Photobacterium proteolyticum]|uniref:Ferrous iron transport protein B n=1 Tax=Photobacterium proteolyticum TaxID=1903952 RepID=A0A1Q9GKK4_9GAMM|nr:ferrous iron transport protein B [Photobacterium proteolyticum]OLQ75039.1 ferrous iron transport protein B [Photobacterium proteolyticum]
MTNRTPLVALSGQQNAGKSTLFNLLTGARQHIANYPGVTVDKKYGYFSHNNLSYQAVDLPGTYSLSSFSLEERVARDFLCDENPDLVINVVDAANLKRSLHLTVQLLEMECPTILALNMMDVADREGITIDTDTLSQRLAVPVVTTIGRKGEGRSALCELIQARTSSGTHSGSVENADNTRHESQPYYPALTAAMAELDSALAPLTAQIVQLPYRWLKLKLLENDAQLIGRLAARVPDEQLLSLQNLLAELRTRFEQQHNTSINDYIAAQREAFVQSLMMATVTVTPNQGPTLSQKIDKLVLNRFLAPVFLIMTVFLIYQLAIVQGYELTNYTWPYLAAMREWVAALLPEAGFLFDPYTRSLGLWIVDSANTLLNYVPIFIILFALIAILEDSGYMARIAFVVDKILHRFGLHGQSTLPLILSGVFAGGCAVPGIMATKGIPDHRARMATILTVPFMNCLAKVPLYALLVGIFFEQDKALMMFYISTMTIIAALLVAKLLSVTVLRGEESAPFVIELPRYNLPTVRSVLTRSVERTWIYIKKVGTIVVAVSVVIFTLLQYPGLPEDRSAFYQQRSEQAISRFNKAMNNNPYLELAQGEQLVSLMNYYNDFKRAKLNAKGATASRAVNETFKQRSPEFFPFVKAPKGDKLAKKANRALRKLAKARKSIRREIKEERLSHSLLGSIGRSLEPVTRFAGFDWKINVALLSSFAARESSVATLGVLFQQEDDQNTTLEERMGDQGNNLTSLTAVSMILFFALYPPCLATMIMVRVQTGQYRWMLLALLFPTALGLGVSSTTYSLGMALGISGITMMSGVYFSGLALLLLVGLYPVFRRKQKSAIPTTPQDSHGVI